MPEVLWIATIPHIIATGDAEGVSKASLTVEYLPSFETICKRSGLDLVKTTPPWEEKFNLFFFSPAEVLK